MNLNKVQEESMNFFCYIGILDHTIDKLFKRSLAFLGLISLQLAGVEAVGPCWPNAVF